MRQADRSPPEQARDLRRKALAHLELAEARGVPTADRNRLYFRLARVVYQSDGDLQRVIKYINRLSDLFCVLSRWIAKQTGQTEYLWQRGLMERPKGK